MKTIQALPVLVGTGLIALSVGCGSTDSPDPTLDPKQASGLRLDVAASIELGEMGGVALAVGEGGVWVASYQADSASVTHVDSKDTEIVATIPFDGVDDVAVGAGAVWVLGSVRSEDESRTAVFRVDPETHDLVATIPLDCVHASRLPECSPMTLAAAEGGVWVGLHRTLGPSRSAGEVVRIDPASNEVVAHIPIQSRPQDVVLGEGAVWVSSHTLVEGEGFDRGPLLRIDPRTNEVAATLLRSELGGATGVPEIALGEDALWTSAYVFEPSEARLAVRIDAETGEVVRDPIDVHHFSPFAVAEGGVWFYGDGGTLSRLNPGTLEVNASVDLPARIVDADFDPATRSFWVVDDWPSVVHRINLS